MQRNLWYCPRICVELRTFMKNRRTTTVNAGPLKYKAGLLCIWSQSLVKAVLTTYICLVPGIFLNDTLKSYLIYFHLFIINGSTSSILCACDQGQHRLGDKGILDPGRSRFKGAIIEDYLKWFKAQHFKYSKGIPFTLQGGWDTTFFCRYSRV
jgi:hypothetical protein